MHSAIVHVKYMQTDSVRQTIYVDCTNHENASLVSLEIVQKFHPVYDILKHFRAEMRIPKTFY